MEKDDNANENEYEDDDYSPRLVTNMVKTHEEIQAQGFLQNFYLSELTQSKPNDFIRSWIILLFDCCGFY
jgi:hypothetical protein